jgi:hypothetical protein
MPGSRLYLRSGDELDIYRVIYDRAQAPYALPFNGLQELALERYLILPTTMKPFVLCSIALEKQ